MKRAVWIYPHRFRRQPLSGGCVLKLFNFHAQRLDQLQPPSGGCVFETYIVDVREFYGETSRLRAAVC